jgi:hypothetical protein
MGSRSAGDDNVARPIGERLTPRLHTTTRASVGEALQTYRRLSDLSGPIAHLLTS